MTNKTCEDCMHFETCDYLDMCVVKCETRRADSVCNYCNEFVPKDITNGDWLRQLSNEELARKFGYPCPPIPNKHCKGISNEECTECWLAWLNAPAKSEGEDE